MITDLTRYRMQTKVLQPGLPVLHLGHRSTQCLQHPSVLTHSALSDLCTQVLVLGCTIG